MTLLYTHLNTQKIRPMDTDRRRIAVAVAAVRLTPLDKGFHTSKCCSSPFVVSIKIHHVFSFTPLNLSPAVVLTAYTIITELWIVRIFLACDRGHFSLHIGLESWPGGAN